MMLSYVTHYLTLGIENSFQLLGEFPFMRSGPTTKRWRCAKLALHFFAALAGLASLVFFVCGVFDIKNAISSLHLKP